RQRRRRQPARRPRRWQRRRRQVLQRGMRRPPQPAGHHRAPRTHARPEARENASTPSRGGRAAYARRYRSREARFRVRAPRRIRRGSKTHRRLLHREDSMRMWSLRMWLGLFVIGSALVVAIGHGSAPAQTHGGSLVVQSTTEPPGLDLTASPASAIAGVVFYNVQEDLVKVDSRGKLVPWLAERWYTTDSKNYTFFLRKGVRFHTGPGLKRAAVKVVVSR